jgi:hypothetical protein
VFLAVASLPTWCAAVGTWFMPESPRFLLVQGYTEAAEQVGGWQATSGCLGYRIAREL